MLTDVEGIRVGHWTDAVGKTGCTVILPPDGTVGSCEWRGGAPGDREWVLLQPEQRVDRVHGIVLSGGSAFGLATADGVMRWLEERDVGWDIPTLGIKVPIVPAAILFDLGVGDPRARPGAEQGYLACSAASDGPIETGRVGAGTGCTAGKIHGPQFGSPSGIGSASISEGELVVAALVASNPVGEVLSEDGSVLAGSTAPEGTPPMFARPMQNTVIGVVSTNAILTKHEAHALSKAGQDGIAAVVSPAHTRYDGDVIFGLGTCRVSAPIDQVLALGAMAVKAAIRQGVRAAGG